LTPRCSTSARSRAGTAPISSPPRSRGGRSCCPSPRHERGADPGGVPGDLRHADRRGSIQTLVAAPAHHVALLAAVEIAGALMLMWRRTQWVGASVLLLVFAGAQVLSAVGGEYPTRFLQCAASTLLIVLLDRTLAQADTAASF